jgi:hypothetical protein
MGIPELRLLIFLVVAIVIAALIVVGILGVIRRVGQPRRDGDGG